MAKRDVVLDLPVKVSAALCKVRIPAGELAAVAAGDVFEVEGDADSALLVALTIGNQVVAHAAIVEQNGRLIARIVEPAQNQNLRSARNGIC